MEQPPVRFTDQRTIFVVDDDPVILGVVHAILSEDAHYDIVTATAGADALNQSIHFKGDIHLLLSDFQMPEMTGVELATQMTVQRPELKVLLMSGFPGGMLVLNEGWHFLAKPFVASQLRALVAGLVFPDRPSKFST
jgi:two-component system, cell cycle sensor histidine kinase and response regulator CckA